MKNHYDLTIVGSGISGLMAAKKASLLGIHTLLIERSNRIAGGSSTRNEGWLHAGTYHATSIEDKNQAIQVAQRTLYGHNQIRTYAPEVVEDPLTKTVCLVRENDLLESILERWREAGVAYREIKRDYFFAQIPNIKKDHVTNVFEVADVSINTRMLYARLLHDAKSNGVNILMNTGLKFDGGRNPTLITGGKNERLQSRLFVYTAGYGSADILRNELGIELPLRHWKSHLLITPKLTDCGVFNLSLGEAALMNHQYCSIIGFNEDAYIIEKPNFDVEPERVISSLAALERFMQLPKDFRYVPVSCIKVDAPVGLNISRSLNVNIVEPIPNHIFAFPGKMTETPYLIDVLMRVVFERLDNEDVSFRPCDEAKSVIFCKDGIEFDGASVVKKHRSEDGARLEQRIAELYASNTTRIIRVPEYKGFFVRDEKPCLLMERINGRTALGHADYNLAERLIGDLALFHHMFSQHSSPERASVLYRDSIPSNYIIKPDGHVVHIDFSSSDRFIHAWDDVALLLNSAWSTLSDRDREKLIEAYVLLREQFSITPRFTAQLPRNPDNQTEEQRRQYYIETTKRMLATGFTQVSLLKKFDTVDFTTLRREDFGVFDEFRNLRANFYKQKIWGNK